MIVPYRSTPVFDEKSLPAALRGEHSTKAGVWGVICVLEGRMRLDYADPPSTRLLEAGEAGLCAPQRVHSVAPLGPMRMRVDFYDRDPRGTGPL